MTRDWRAYRREWRRTHRATENARKARLRAQPGWRKAHEPGHRPERRVIPLPPLHSGHPLFDQARAIVGPRRTAYVTLYDPLYDDLISVATLAILQGDDPTAAVNAFRTAELRWGRVTLALYTFDGAKAS